MSKTPRFSADDDWCRTPDQYFPLARFTRVRRSRWMVLAGLLLMLAIALWLSNSGVESLP